MTSQAAEAAHTAPERGRRGAIWLLLAVVALAALGVFWRTRQDATPPAVAPMPDLPHLDGTYIVLPPKFAQMAGMRSAPVERKLLTPAVKVVGTVTFNPAHVAAVGTRARGLVHDVKLFEGDAVHKGDVLAEIESSELGQAEADVTTAQAQLHAAEQNRDREAHLHKEGLTTAREVEVARATVAEQKALLGAARQRMHGLVSKGGQDAALPIGRYSLRAPLDGTVIERHIHDGQSVQDSLVAFRIADLGQLWVELQVTDRHLVGMAREDAVEIRSLAQPDRPLHGRVAYVGDVIDPITGAAPVRVEIDNSERILRPGQSVTAAIRPRGGERQAIVVPAAAVTWIDGQATVFVEKLPLRLLAVPVTIGASDGNFLEIVQGIEAADRVVVEGVFAIKSELYR